MQGLATGLEVCDQFVAGGGVCSKGDGGISLGEPLDFFKFRHVPWRVAYDCIKTAASVGLPDVREGGPPMKECLAFCKRTRLRQ